MFDHDHQITHSRAEKRQDVNRFSGASTSAMTPFDAILNNIAYQPAQLLAARLAAYRKALFIHDWAYRYSDDVQIYRWGKAARAELQAARAELDADYAIWNSIAPSDCLNGLGEV